MAEESTSRKADPKVSVEKPEPLVTLYLRYPHARFDLSGVGLEDLVPEGTAYPSSKADVVRVMCMKYGIGFNEAP